MPSEFVTMLLKKAQGEQLPELPDLEPAVFNKVPRLDVTLDADRVLYYVTLGDQQYCRLDDVHYVYIRTNKQGEPHAYWRKVNVAAVRIMKQIDEVIANGCENTRTYSA
ncbi:hypothetical protein LT875_002481 [Salmonella enterica]|nr:hypothetical protein [Salmonella enterica]